MQYVVLFLAGAFLVNAIPHLVSGLRGETFPTPFATPRGRGPSSPFVNVLWGGLNAIVGSVLLSLYPVSIGFTGGFLSLVAGALALGTFCALHFEDVRRGGWKS